MGGARWSHRSVTVDFQVARGLRSLRIHGEGREWSVTAPLAVEVSVVPWGVSGAVAFVKRVRGVD